LLGHPRFGSVYVFVKTTRTPCRRASPMRRNRHCGATVRAMARQRPEPFL